MFQIGFPQIVAALVFALMVLAGWAFRQVRYNRRLEEVTRYLDCKIWDVTPDCRVVGVVAFMPDGGIMDDLRPTLTRHYQRRGFDLSFDDEARKIRMMPCRSSGAQNKIPSKEEAYRSL
jgi:hypothetical protein